MKYQYTVLFVITAFLISSYSHGLPPQIESDRQLIAAKNNIIKGDYYKALNHLKNINDLNMDIPSEYYYLYGKVLFENNQVDKTIYNIEKYLSIEGQDAKYYTQALELYNLAENRKSSGFFEMVKVPGGCFSTRNSSRDKNNDKGSHYICMDDYLIGKYEVTQIQWQTVMGDNPSGFSGCSACPVENVSWNDVQIFLYRLNRNTKQQYRLPSEAEWEYACRGRGKNQTYCGGKNLFPLAWNKNNSGRKTHPVGGKSPNGLGLYDMSGNVSEWIQAPYKILTPIGSADSPYQVHRGCSWHNNRDLCHSSLSLYSSPDTREYSVGLRLARTP